MSFKNLLVDDQTMITNFYEIDLADSKINSKIITIKRFKTTYNQNKTQSIKTIAWIVNC